MLNLLNSLSLASGSVIASVISLLILFVFFRKNGKIYWLSAIVVPIIISVSLYRLPVYLGASAAEYDAWMLAIVPFWAVSAVLLSLIMKFFLDKRPSKH